MAHTSFEKRQFIQRKKNVLSANKRGVHEITLRKSLIYNKKNNGPKIEP